jgi:hypothetical protein
MPRELTPIDVDGQEPTKSGLGGLVENTLVRFAQRVINSAAHVLSEIIELGLEIFLEAIEEALIDINRPIIERLMGDLPEGSPLLPYFRAMLKPTHEAGAISLAGFGMSMGSTAAGNLLQVLLRPLGYELDGQMYTARLDPSAAFSAVWRGVLSTTEAEAQLKDLGWSDRNRAVWYNILRPLLNERDILALWVRGKISEATAREKLAEHGYDAEQANHMRLVIEPLLGADDVRSLYLRDIIGSGEFRTRLEQLGYNEGDVGALESLTWRILGGGDVTEAFKRGLLEEGKAREMLRANGYPDSLAPLIMEITRPLTALDDLVTLYLREFIGVGEFMDRVKQYGYTDKQLAEVMELTQRIPGPGDLISMAVREAFNPEFVSRYQYLSGFPKEFGEWMKKQGYSEDWAHKYWVAHWALPSISMAYTMFHRRIIDLGDLENLLTAADIAPFWRPKLIEAAYQPLTRVDVRRMYQLGVLGRKDVYDSYLDLGYSPENAEYMTQFTELYALGDDREGSKADILKAYRLGIIGGGTALGYLKDMGYTDEWATYYLLMEEIKYQDELLDDKLALLKPQYTEGIITRSDVFVALGEWDLPSTQIETYLAQWDVTKAGKIAVPSPGQLEEFYKRGIISVGSYRDQMEARHYEEGTITWFIRQIDQEIAEEALAEEERARTEQDRLATTEVKTAYEVRRADLDVQIAQLKVALAENTVLIGVITDYELMDELFRLNDEIKLAIKQLEEDKARAKLELTETLEGMGG